VPRLTALAPGISPVDPEKLALRRGQDALGTAGCKPALHL